MNEKIRKKLSQRLAEKAGIKPTTTLTYKDCSKIAALLECDDNTIARLVALEKFKPTQILKPEMELKIAAFLGYPSYEKLELSLMVDVVADHAKSSLIVLLLITSHCFALNTT
ncbi:MAG: hypothetical protein ACOVQA_07330 [Thermoflexibacteraceae bacterium]|jgi:hypothetical protein